MIKMCFLLSCPLSVLVNVLEFCSVKNLQNLDSAISSENDRRGLANGVKLMKDREILETEWVEWMVSRNIHAKSIHFNDKFNVKNGFENDFNSIRTQIRLAPSLTKLELSINGTCDFAVLERLCSSIGCDLTSLMCNKKTQQIHYESAVEHTVLKMITNFPNLTSLKLSLNQFTSIINWSFLMNSFPKLQIVKIENAHHGLPDENIHQFFSFDKISSTLILSYT